MTNNKTDFQCVIVGARIISLSIARSIAKKNKKVLVLEKK